MQKGGRKKTAWMVHVAETMAQMPNVALKDVLKGRVQNIQKGKSRHWDSTNGDEKTSSSPWAQDAPQDAPSCAPSSQTPRWIRMFKKADRRTSSSSPPLSGVLSIVSVFDNICFYIYYKWQERKDVKKQENAKAADNEGRRRRRKTIKRRIKRRTRRKKHRTRRRRRRRRRRHR